MATPAPEAYEYTAFQDLVHRLPLGLNKFLGGGRGGAKSECVAQDIYIECAEHGADARLLFLRQGPKKSLGDFEEVLGRIFNVAWGPNAHELNHSSLRWTVPTGSHLELGILPDGDAGRKYYERTYQGRSYTKVYVDEAQQYARPEVIDLLDSNLRGPIPTSKWLNANPGGIGHQWIAERYVNAAAPWHTFVRDVKVELGGGHTLKTRQRWISCPSTYRDNPHNGPNYLSNLATSCGNDLELLKAWITGSWAISRGAYFAASLDNRYIKTRWPVPEDNGTKWDRGDWRAWLSFDHGSAAPSVCYVIFRSPGGVGPDGLFYPDGSLIVADEYAVHRPGDLGAGFGWAVPKITPGIKKLAARWGIPARGTADDACFGQMGHSNPHQPGQGRTMADEYRDEGVVWHPARKGRRAPRFLKMKRMFHDCGSLETPGLYVDERCRYFWSTVPYLVHDPLDPEVVLKCGTDHGLDAMSYGLEGDKRMSSFMRAM